MVINLADSLTMIADGLVVSRGLGPKALAAITLADPSYRIATLFAGVLSAGMQALCSQALGSGDSDKANGVFSAGMIMAAAAAILLTGICFFFTDGLCRLFGAGSEKDAACPSANDVSPYAFHHVLYHSFGLSFWNGRPVY